MMEFFTTQVSTHVDTVSAYHFQKNVTYSGPPTSNHIMLKNIHTRVTYDLVGLGTGGEGKVTVGRRHGNYIRLECKRIPMLLSRDHAAFVFNTDGTISLDDMNSVNGTYLTRTGVVSKIDTQTVLMHGDIITFGDSLVSVYGRIQVNPFQFRYIDTLPDSVVKDDIDLKCPICLDWICDCHKVQCGHMFCGSCIKQWLKQRRTCPMCRANVKARTVPCHEVDRVIDGLSVTPHVMTSLEKHKRATTKAMLNYHILNDA